MVMLQKWSLNGGGQFKGGRMVVTEVARGRIVMLQRWSV